ncbi:MAG: mechanosensitive ion channel family protein [Nanoarchaeota archaeon]
MALIDSISGFTIRYSSALIRGAIILIVGWLLIRIFKSFLRRFFARVDLDRTVEVFVEKSIAGVLWVIIILMIVANFGVNITAFVAGLGIAGFIIGFATKDIFANLAAGLLLLITRPFGVDDSVEAGGIKGIVRTINMSATTIISEDDVYVVVPNARIYGTAIKNFSRSTK